MKKRKKTILVSIVCILGIIISGVLAFQQPKGSEKQKRIIFISKTIDQENDFWVQLTDGATMAAKENGMELTVVAPEKEIEFEKQNELIYWAIDQKPDAIIVAPSSSTKTAAAVEDVKKKGIPVVLVDSDVESDEKFPVVATDNVEAGRLQGEYMREFLNEESQIVLVSHVEGSSTAIDREKGIRQGLQEFEDQIVEVVYCDSNYEKAYDRMNQILNEYDHIDMVAGLNEYAAVGAAKAIVERGLNEIHMVGFDSSRKEIQLLEEGVFEGIVIQNPYQMGYLAVEEVKKILSGEKSDRRIDSGEKLIKRDEIFTEENQKLLFMFTEE